MAENVTDRDVKAARRWFHGAAWFGLVATTYTNYRAAPVVDLQVAYLAVPVLLAFVSEGMIHTWPRLAQRYRTLGASILAVLILVSYEHLRHMTEVAGGTWVAANIGAAAIDATIFACVLMTCVLSRDTSQDTKTSQDTLTVLVSRQDTPSQDTPRLETPKTPAIETSQDTKTPEQDTKTSRVSKTRLGDDALVALLRDTHAGKPGVREAMRTLSCGDAKARRLINLGWNESDAPPA